MKVFSRPTISVEELETRHELSVVAPEIMVTDCARCGSTNPDYRCVNDADIPIEVVPVQE